MSWLSGLDWYNAACDAENGFSESPALERLSGVTKEDFKEDFDPDDYYSEKEMEIIDGYLSFHKGKKLEELLKIYNEEELNLIMNYVRGHSSEE